MRTALVVAKLPTMRATPFPAAVCALALLPAPVSGQAPSSAREQLVWHWFGGCAGNDSLFLEFHVDGKLVYSATFPICHVRRARRQAGATTARADVPLRCGTTSVRCSVSRV